MSERIKKIKETYSDRLQKCRKEEKLNGSIDTAWDILISADPSPNKKNVRWLVETYINHGYLWEDIKAGPLSKVAETLVEFNKHKGSLEPENRSLNKYNDLGTLWSVIKPYVGQMTANEEKREERERAYAEAEVVMDREDGFKIIVPKTEYAAQWFGKGTRWCTSAQKSNMFHYYAKQAPLFIIFMSNGDKLQFWKHKDIIQFMDDNDSTVRKEYIQKHWDDLGPLFKNSSKYLFYMPEKLKTREICEEAVSNHGVALQNVPTHMKDQELCTMAVQNNGLSIQYAPIKEQTDALCRIAIQQNPHAFRNIKQNNRTKELCEFALQCNPEIITQLTHDFKKEHFYKIAIKNGLKSLKSVPEEYRTEEICKQAVINDGRNLEHLLSEYKTQEVCDIAIKTCGWALKWMKRKDLTRKRCEDAVKTHGDALHYVPDHMRTPGLCKIAVNQNPWAIKHVPEHLRHRNMCLDVFSNTPMTYNLIPEKHISPEFFKEAVQRNWKTLSKIPHEYHTKELYELAIKQDPNSLSYMIQTKVDKNLCDLALAQNKEDFNPLYIPLRLRDNYSNKIYKIKNEHVFPLELYKKNIEDLKESFRVFGINREDSQYQVEMEMSQISNDDQNYLQMSI